MDVIWTCEAQLMVVIEGKQKEAAATEEVVSKARQSVIPPTSFFEEPCQVQCMELTQASLSWRFGLGLGD